MAAIVEFLVRMQGDVSFSFFFFFQWEQVGEEKIKNQTHIGLKSLCITLERV